ncbi:protein kinase [Collinsella sp. D33t1_170424_A12]|uniref:serine/threonine protein kinase n=1 Tax=Collinsella sp. D33t1_170424_A12 TaxID=2787135 RepID=UPI0018992145|nr:protein kinase [Collinsella sp. D33t1_170424_A12]
MAEYRRRIPGLNNDQIMHAMGIDDAYHVERVLARGRNGATELVTIEGAGPFVRKKMPLEDANRSVWAALAGGDCPRLPQVVATYEMPDCFVVVCDYVPGEALEDLVGRAGALDAGVAVPLARDVCEALAALHACGVAHLDIAPGNVVVAADGAHLVDFGNARPIAVDTGLADGVVRPRGTWGFAAPEQFFSRAGVCSDVFSAGRLLGYMLTAIEPDEDCISEFEAALRDESRVPVSARRLVERATNFEPSARYQGAREFAAALDGALRGEDADANAADASTSAAGPVAAPANDPDAPEEPAPHALASDAQRAPGRRMRSIAHSISLLMLAGAVVAGGLVIAYKAFTKPTRPPLSASDAEAGRVEDIGPASGGGAAREDDVRRAAESLRIIESGWRANEAGLVDFAIVIKNASGDLAVDDAAVCITGRDEDGFVLFSTTQAVGALFPQTTTAFASMCGNGTKPATVEFSLEKPMDFQVRRNAGKPTAYKVHGASVASGASGRTTVSGEVEMVEQGDEEFTTGIVWLSAVFRDVEGAIVTGASGYVTAPDPGERAPFSIDSFYCPEYATVDVVARAL